MHNGPVIALGDLYNILAVYAWIVNVLNIFVHATTRIIRKKSGIWLRYARKT